MTEAKPSLRFRAAARLYDGSTWETDRDTGDLFAASPEGAIRRFFHRLTGEQKAACLSIAVENWTHPEGQRFPWSEGATYHGEPVTWPVHDGRLARPGGTLRADETVE